MWVWERKLFILYMGYFIYGDILFIKELNEAKCKG